MIISLPCCRGAQNTGSMVTRERQDSADRRQQRGRFRYDVDVAHEDLQLVRTNLDTLRRNQSILGLMFRITACIVPYAPLERLAAWITVEQDTRPPLKITVYRTDNNGLTVSGWNLSPIWLTRLETAIRRAETDLIGPFRRETAHEFAARRAERKRRQEREREQLTEAAAAAAEAAKPAPRRSKRDAPAKPPASSNVPAMPLDLAASTIEAPPADTSLSNSAGAAAAA